MGRNWIPLRRWGLEAELRSVRSFPPGLLLRALALMPLPASYLNSPEISSVIALVPWVLRITSGYLAGNC